MSSGSITLPVLGGGGGTGNILSINGDTAANQFIAGGTNIAVVSGGGITTINLNGPVPISLGGTGQSNQQAALNNLTDIGSHSNGDVMQLLSGNAQFAPLSFPPAPVTSVNGQVGAVNVAVNGSTIPSDASFNFAYSNSTNFLDNLPGWSVDPIYFGASVQSQGHIIDDGYHNWNFFNLNLDPSIASPSALWNNHFLQVSLDPNNTGFDIGTSGQAVRVLDLFMSHQGKSNTGSLAWLQMEGNLGNGTDPISIKGMGYSFGFLNVAANVTIDGQFQGYGFQPNIDAAAIGTSNFNVNVFYDFANIPIPVNGYNGFISNPNVASITNNHSFSAFSSGPNITALTGNANYTGVGLFPNITTVDVNGGYQGFQSSPNITTLGANSYFAHLNCAGTVTTMGGAGNNYNGVGFFPTITTGHGNISGMIANPTVSGGDAQVQLYQGNLGQVHSSAQCSVLNLSGVTADGNDSACNINGISFNAGGTMIAASSLGVQVKHVIFTQFEVPDSTAITGTDCLMNVLSPDINFGNAGSSLAIGPDGLGSAFVAFAAQMHGHGSCAQMSALIPGAIFAEDFILTDWRNVNAVQLNAGFSGTVTNATAFYHEITGAGPFATNHWGLRVVTDIDNFVTKMAINTASQKVTSANVRLQIENGHLKSTQTTAPTAVAQAGAGTGASAILTNATDMAGNLELDLGTLTLASGAQVVITFNKTYAVAPIVNITPTNGPAAANSAAFGIFITSTTNDFTINFASVGVALTTLEWNYQIIETQ